MEESISVEEYQDAYREVRMEEEKSGFYGHLVAYLIVNTLLIIMNLVFTPGFLWFFFPLIGWGIGITFHYLNSFHWLKGELEEKEAKAEKRARDKKKK